MVDATWQTGEYFEDLALSNTAEDQSQSFISPEQMQGAEFWLAVAWVGAGIDLAAGVKVLGLLRAGSSVAKALRAVGHAGKEAELIGATLPKNVGTELRRLGSHLDSDPAWALAGGQGIGPYDRVIRNPQVPNDEVRALRPDGWASQEEGGASVHAMSMGDESSVPGQGAGGRREFAPLGEGREVDAVHLSPERTHRMPRDEHGHWEYGTPGEGAFWPSQPDILAITMDQPIVFKNRVPDLEPFAVLDEGTVRLDAVTGGSSDFGPADPALAQKMGWTRPNGEPNASAARRFRTGRFTWHHQGDCVTLVLVDMVMHAKLAHLGGSSLVQDGLCD